MDRRKKFDYELFKQNDKLARDVGKAYWESKGRTVIDNPDRYGPDLLIDGEYYCEVEIKRAWKGKEFKYRTCQIPHRKAKYLDKDKYDKPTHFFIINNEQEYAFYIKGEDVAASPVVEVPNKFVPKGEFFFQIPLSKLKLIDLNDKDNQE